VTDVDVMAEVLVYDYDRAALTLGVSASFLRKQVMAGRIMHNKLGRNVRFTRAYLDAYLAGHRATNGCPASSSPPVGAPGLSAPAHRSRSRS
jgi:excisionase family DNA binding protein